MNIDDKIDVCLKKLYEAGEKNQFTLFADALYGDSFMYDVPDPIDRAMINKGLIERMKDARMLTELGIRISQQGGWKEYLKKEEAKHREDHERQKREDTKLQYDLRVAKFSAKTIVWFFVFSCLSLLISVYTLFKKEIDELITRITN